MKDVTATERETEMSVASALTKAVLNVSGRKRGLCKLIVRQPKRFHLPGVDRERSQIDSSLRARIAACVAGEEPWPLLIWGAPGVGKTCAALCVLDMAGGHYTTVAHLCERHNDATMRKLEIETWPGEWLKPTPRQFRRIYLESPALLVLDEIGAKEKVSDAHYEVVKHALDARVDRAKPMILISNNTPEQIGMLYDARILSRIASGTVVEVKGDDRRLQ